MAHNDYPIQDCIKMVTPFVEAGCHFHQKFTCEKCRSRQTIETKDQFFASGQCEECEHVTDLRTRGCNYVLMGPSDVIAQVQDAVALIPCVMRVVKFANNAPCPIAGEWLKEFDFEYGNGRGDGLFTDDPRKAMVFDSKRNAIAFWNTVAQCRPLRDDGLPNKPLTATSCVIEPRDLAIKTWRKSK